MDRSTQEDSLVFASPSKHKLPLATWLDPHNDTDTFVNDTLADNDATGVDDEDTFLFSRPESPLSPRISRLSQNPDLSGSENRLRRGVDTLGETQVIQHNAGGQPDIGHDTWASPSDSALISLPLPPTEVADTQIISGKSGESHNNQAYTKKTLVGASSNSPAESAIRRPLYKSLQPSEKPNGCFDDTQKLPGTFTGMPGETQSDPFVEVVAESWLSKQQDTQIIGEPRLLPGSAFASLPRLHASPVLAYEATQLDHVPSFAAIDSSPTKTLVTSKLRLRDSTENAESVRLVSAHVNAEFSTSASPNIFENTSPDISQTTTPRNHDTMSTNEAPFTSHSQTNGHALPESVTFDGSFDAPNKAVATTQVLNTQEEYTDAGFDVPLGLSCKRVFSSSQNDGLRRVLPLGIESDDEPSFSLPNMPRKRRRIALESLSQLDHILFGSPIAKLSGPKDDFSGVHDGKSREGDESSSELEDISQDVNNISLSALAASLCSNTPAQSYPQTKHGDSQNPPSSNEKKQTNNATKDANPVSRNDDNSTEHHLNVCPDNHSTKKIQNLRVSSDAACSDNLPLIHLPTQGDTFRENSPADSSSDMIKNVHGVWALYQFKKFPAKVINYGEVFSLVQLSADQKIEARNSDLHLLDICVGDIVQLKMRHEEYVVAGLVFYTVDSTVRCIRGYDTAILKKKPRSTRLGKSALYQEFMVSLEDICMDLSQWTVHQQRFRILHKGIDLLLEDYTSAHQMICAAPANLHDAPVIIEQAMDPQHVSPRKPIKEMTVLRKSDLFAGMMFFVTSIEGPRKEKLKTMIISNGGLFMDGEIGNVVVRKGLGLGLSLRLCLHPCKHLETFAFGALLADSYSRSAKYLQALTLGWPILADCFVDKVLENRDILRNWPVFLLPAGHSTHTNTVANLDIYTFRAKFDSGLLLSEQLQNNNRLLRGYTMIIMDRKQDSKMIDMCDFIFHAFGATDIRICKTPPEVNAHLKTLSAEKCFVYDNSQGEYMKSQDKPADIEHGASNRARYGVIGWEWVVQCVISKYIWNPVHCVEF